jgi:hypothetical protein
LRRYGTVYMLVRAAGLPVGARIVAGVGTAVALRQAAWTYDLRLPTYGTGEGAMAAAGKGDDGRGMRPPLKQVTAVGYGRHCPPRHPTHVVEPSLLSKTAPYDVASNIRPANCPPRHPTHV